ncbi:MAG: triose-phosphate isomerase [Bdellovibrionota bacterium]
MRPIIIGNWKMNLTVEEGIRLVTEIKTRLSGKQEAEIVVAPPFTSLHPLGIAITGSSIKLAAQNVYEEEYGAYTGEISAPMLLDLDCEYVIIGHSERRQYFQESDASLARKVAAVLEHEMSPIFCVGENLEEREAQRTLSIIEHQLHGGLQGLSDDDIERVVIAYEPVWAIGTGKTASPEMAQEVHTFIRGWLEQTRSKSVASQVRIVYGGSVKPENISPLMRQKDIDGALVGGASLAADAFVKIVQFGE